MRKPYSIVGLLLFFTIFLGVISSNTTYAQNRNSDLYSPFNNNTPERAKFVLQKTAEFKNKINKTPNYSKIFQSLKQSQQKERVLHTVYLENNVDTLEVIDRGLGKSQELVKRVGEQETVLLSNTSYSKNNSLRFLGITINNNDTYLAVIFSQNGSKDNAFLTIMNLKTNKLVSNFPLISHGGISTEVFWQNDQTLLLNQIDANNEFSIKKVVLNEDNFEISNYMQGLNIYEVLDPYVPILTDRSLTKFSILDADSSELFAIPFPKDQWEHIRRKKSKLYFINRTLKSDGTELSEIFVNSFATNNFEKIAEFDGVIKKINLVNDALVYQQRINFEIVLTHYNLLTQVKTSIKLPDFINLTKAVITKNPQELKLTAMSDLGKSQPILWNIETNTLNIDAALLKSKLLSSPELELEVQFKNIISFDGTKVAVRIVHKKGLLLEKAPAFIQAYGGFGVDSYLEPSLHTTVLDFIQRGGLYVGTSLRGDGGNGIAGHFAAKKHLKFKTFEDLASVAKHLIDTGMSTPEKIITWGGSNGGLTVTASAMAFPQYFGLVISSAGVLDLLGKEKLDSRYDNGWSSEYGNSTSTDGAHLAGISPLENIKKMKDGPQYLFVTGKHDTRVNPAHTYKMMWAIEEFNNSHLSSIKADLLTINNTGHHMMANDSDYIAVYNNTAQWTAIYNFLKIDF